MLITAPTDATYTRCVADGTVWDEESIKDRRWGTLALAASVLPSSSSLPRVWVHLINRRDLFCASVYTCLVRPTCKDKTDSTFAKLVD